MLMMLVSCFPDLTVLATGDETVCPEGAHVEVETPGVLPTCTEPGS